MQAHVFDYGRAGVVGREEGIGKRSCNNKRRQTEVFLPSSEDGLVLLFPLIFVKSRQHSTVFPVSKGMCWLYGKGQKCQYGSQGDVFEKEPDFGIWETKPKILPDTCISYMAVEITFLICKTGKITCPS